MLPSLFMLLLGVINPAYLGSCYGEKLISPLMQQAGLRSLGQAAVFVVLKHFFKLALKSKEFKPFCNRHSTVTDQHERKV